ncbi:MAG: TetR/AcrR family transcriptional regulator [Thermodesulfobacteriota bacterium]
MARNNKKNDQVPTRDAILDAAEAIFCDKGFADTSVSAIADRAVVTKSLIHHHFGSKENLWHQVKQRRHREYSRIQLDLFASPDPDAICLRDSIIQYFSFLKKNPEFVRLMSWSLVETTHPERDLEDRISVLAIAKIEQAQKLGHIRSDVDPMAVLVMVYSLVLHWFQARNQYLTWVKRDPHAPEADRDYLDGMLTIFFEGVLPRETGHTPPEDQTTTP